MVEAMPFRGTLALFLLFTLSFCLDVRKSYKEGPHIRIAAVGDVMCHRPQLEAAYETDCECYRFDSVFAPLSKYLQNAHLSIANLETTLPGKPHLYRGYPFFGSPDALARALYRRGIDLLTLANNHSLDNGAAGLLRTLKTVHKIGFYSLGTYSSQKDWEARRVLLIKKNGFKLAFLNYSKDTNGIAIPKNLKVNLMRRREIAADLKAAHELKPDAIIVLYHFGGEYRLWPSARQKAYAHYAFWHGADVVLGTHPHVVQPYRIVQMKDIYGRRRKRLVAYSLGNFISSQRWRYANGGIIFYFDLIKKRSYRNRNRKAEILFGGIGYEPVWVYIKYEKKNRKYYVLPIKEYLKNDKEMKLAPRDYQAMLQFFRDTKRHLRQSQISVRRFSH